MKSIKTFAFCIFWLCLSAMANALTYRCDFTEGGIHYKITSDSTVAVTYESVRETYDEDYYTCGYSGDIIIPSSVIHDGVEYAVTSIGRYAFYPDDYESLVTSVTLPNSIVSIDGAAFSYCNKLTSLVIPESVRTISASAFQYCSALQDIKLPEGLDFAGSNPFYGCTSLPVIDGLRYADTYLVQAVDKTLSTYNIRPGTSCIISSAFSGCSFLKYIVIPNSVTKLGNYTFTGCTALSDISLSKSLMSIGTGAFQRCEMLQTIHLPEGLKEVGGSAFYDCKGLTNISFPSAVTKIEGSTFCGCSALVSVDLPMDLTYIGSYAFAGCSSLASIVIPDKTKEVREGAFNLCTSLESLVIGDSVMYLYNSAFNGCSELKTVTMGASLRETSTAFSRCGKITELIYPEGCETTIDTGIISLTSVSLPSTLKTIGYRSFCNCTQLTEVNIPSTVTSIEEQAFIGCSRITSFDLPQTLTFIGKSAFNGCNSLTSLSIPNSVTTIESGAFSGCRGLTDISLPCGLTSIEEQLFYRCENLESLVLPDSVKSIGWLAFNECKKLVSINIPNTVTKIGKQAFYSCYALQSITIPAGVTFIGEQAFSGCSNLKSVTNMSKIPQDIAYSTFSTYGTLHVIMGCKDVYKGTAVWNMFNIVDDVDDPGQVTYDFADGRECNITKTHQVESLTYTRTFATSDWEALYLPLSLSYTDWADCLEVADINNIHQYDTDGDGKMDDTELEITIVRSGALEPNTPYLVRAKEAGEYSINVSDATLYCTESTGFSMTNRRNVYDFRGSYSQPVLNNVYTMNEGQLVLSPSAIIQPQRWYLTITPRGTALPESPSRIRIRTTDDYVDGIAEFGDGSKNTCNPVIFDLQGRRVLTGQTKSGMYIVNGRKVVK